MSKKIEKLFKSYRDQLLHLAKLYGVVEIKSYARSSKRLSISQLELLLIKNRIKLPVNRSSDKAIAKQELKENAIRNIYLSVAFIFFIGCLIVMRPYIKNTVNEVKFTYVAQEYKSTKTDKSKKAKIKKDKKIETAKKSETTEVYDNTVSLNAETTLNLFDDLGYDLKGVRAGQKVKPIYLTKLPKDLKTLGDTKKKRELFIKIVLPLILHENEKIIEDRKQYGTGFSRDRKSWGHSSDSANSSLYVSNPSEIATVESVLIDIAKSILIGDEVYTPSVRRELGIAVFNFTEWLQGRNVSRL